LYAFKGKSSMKNNKSLEVLKIPLIILIVFLLSVAGGLFYWYEYRPSMVRGLCSEFAEKESGKDLFVYEIIYRHCMRKNGLEYGKPDD
jgi:hypothetical protein